MNSIRSKIRPVTTCWSACAFRRIDGHRAAERGRVWIDQGSGADYAANELEPIRARMAQVNDWLGEEVVRFKPYEIPVAA